MMEKNIHQIWIGPYDIPNREKDFVQKVKDINPSFNHFLWTDNNLPKLANNVKEVYDLHYKNGMYAFAADVLKPFIIQQYGGLYLDIDFDAINPFDYKEIENYDMLLIHGDDGDYSITNNIIGSKANSKPINYFVDNIRIDKWVTYYPSVFGEIVKSYLSLPYVTNNKTMLNKCIEHNINYNHIFNLHKYFIHHALYSWSDKNVENFKNGIINYT
jgi:mannosyltransferase OCH1-like enzyme